MLEYILGSKSKERVLLYISVRKQGYAREIAKFYNTELTPIQNQLNKLEIGGILVNQFVGKSRVFSFNPRYPFIKELLSLLEKAVEFLPDDEKSELIIYRKRPRRTGKPL
jgi:predicted transcriptional regulator